MRTAHCRTKLLDVTIKMAFFRLISAVHLIFLYYLKIFFIVIHIVHSQIIAQIQKKLFYKMNYYNPTRIFFKSCPTSAFIWLSIHARSDPYTKDRSSIDFN